MQTSTPTTPQLVKILKENGQDFEWYPTTNEMIYACLRWIPADAESIMDIGAGDGRVLVKFAEKCENASLYGIEISPILVQQQPREIIPVGTDLFEQNLSALPVDYIFCNPIYSEYEEWTCKIIAEGYASKAFLVIPTRWKDSEAIAHALKQRGAESRVIFNGDFLDAERTARAVIDIVEITYPTNHEHWERKPRDPFDIWFDNNIDTFDHAEEVQEPASGEELARKFSHSSIPEMVEAYRAEYKLLESNYRAIFALDVAILKELGIDKANVRDGLKKKMEGLKNKYWKVLFDRLDAITSRLATKPKQRLLDKLTRNTHVEFTENNAYSVVIWAIKNANQYFDDQLIDLFHELATFEGVQNYKSNTRTWQKNGWRYNSRDFSHFKLDYRIVVHRYSAINDDRWHSYDNPGNLNENCHELLADVKAVFSNLGFATHSDSSYARTWVSNKWQNWYTESGEILFQAKAFKNGNIHFRFYPEAIKALNIEAARLLKWVQSADEIVTELGYTPADAKKYYHSSEYILPGNVKLLTTEVGS